MTDGEFIAWLKTSDRVSCLLAEVVASVGGVETTRYLSTTGYTTGPAETPADTHYAGAIVSGGRTAAQLARTGAGTAGLAFTDLELDNLEGNLDAWLADIWHNRSVKLYFGDQRWARADFRLVFDGVANDLSSRSRDVLNLSVRDKLQRLNTTVTSVLLGGATANADRLKPLTLGEVSNLEPLLIDPATLKYQVHQGQIEGSIEVRDYGVPVTATVTAAAGTFTLGATPAGTVTCSIQGDKPAGTYGNTISKLVQRLATGYGTDPFVSGDLDATNLAAFDAANPQPVGIYLSERENVLAVCQQLADSVGAQVVCSEAGLLQLIQLTLPGSGSPTAVTSDNMFEKTLEVVEREPVRAAVKVGYCRNWCVQTNLQTGIPPAHKDLFSKEWLTSTKSDAPTAAAYKLATEPVAQEDTLLLVTADADAECTRRLTMWKTQRTVLRYVGGPELLLERLGGYQTITHSRFGLEGGVTGQIVSIARDWINASVTIEVLV